MRKISVETVVRALNEAGVRYLVAGGLAVVAHGYLRFTADLDLILALDEANLKRALAALESLGYQPRAPVPLSSFTDPTARATWIAEKGLTVFSLWSEPHRETEVDIFVDCPLDFDRAHAASLRMEIGPGVTATFVGYDDLVALKRTAGRPRDLEDLAALERIRKEQGRAGS